MSASLEVGFRAKLLNYYFLCVDSYSVFMAELDEEYSFGLGR